MVRSFPTRFANSLIGVVLLIPCLLTSQACATPGEKFHLALPRQVKLTSMSIARAIATSSTTTARLAPSTTRKSERSERRGSGASLAANTSCFPSPLASSLPGPDGRRVWSRVRRGLCAPLDNAGDATGRRKDAGWCRSVAPHDRKVFVTKEKLPPGSALEHSLRLERPHEFGRGASRPFAGWAAIFPPIPRAR